METRLILTGTWAEIKEQIAAILAEKNANDAGVAVTETTVKPVASAPQTAPAEKPAATSTPAPTGGTELDAKGLPWDGRIHAGTKTKLANGEWKLKRGVDTALVATVIAELKAAQPAAAPAQQVAPTVGQQQAAAMQQAAPVAQTMPSPVQAPKDLQEFMAYTNSIHNSGKANFQQIMEFLATSMEVTNMADVDPSKIPAIAQALQQQFGVPF